VKLVLSEDDAEQNISALLSIRRFGGQFVIKFRAAMEEFSKPRRGNSNYKGNPSIVGAEKYDVAKDVKDLHKSLGFISNKQTIINILCTKTNRQRIEMAKAYKTCYDRDLIGDIKKKFSGDFLNLLLALLTPTGEFYCNEIYDALNRAGTDEDSLVQILCTLSNYEINEVCQKYIKHFEKTLEKDIRSGKQTQLQQNECF
jgi:annexin A7/11